MKNKAFALCPFGGLANRMRAIVSTYLYAKKINMDVKAFWFRDSRLNARFTDLFYPQNIDGLEIVEGNNLQSLLYNNPSKHNLYLPRLFQSLLFKNCLYNLNNTCPPYGRLYFCLQYCR